MAEWGRLTNAAEALLSEHVYNDGLITESQTANILKGKMELVTGPAGNDYAMTKETQVAPGLAYRGGRQRAAVQQSGNPVTTRAQWVNYSSDIVIDGFELEAIGMTTNMLEDGRIDEARVFGNKVYRIIRQALRNALASQKQYVSGTLWGTITDPSVPTEGLNMLFDYTAPWHGMAPDALLPSFETNCPWVDGPPNDLTEAEGKYYRNIPQIFRSKASPAPVTYDILHQANVAMEAAIAGNWIAPMPYKAFAKVTEGAQANQLVPMVIGGSRGWQNRVEVLMYGRVFYYPDAMAPDDGKIRHIHIGDVASMPGDTDETAGFGLKMWAPPEVEDAMEVGMTAIPNPTEITSLPYDPSMPVWMNNWDRAEGQVDSLYNNMTSKHTWCGPYRWKNYIVENLTY